MIEKPPVTFIGARNFTRAQRDRVDLIVLHSMEAPEKGSTAENVARWFASENAPKASAHFCIDSDSIVECVAEHDIAWHAPGANHNGIGIEHAGYAKQSREEWGDEFSRAMLELSAQLCAYLCARYRIPPVFVSAEGLRLGERGITTHKAVTDGLNAGKGHWDPGPGFPIDDYISRVCALMAPPPPDTEPLDFVAYNRATRPILD